ncbi:hypothetical protein F5Y06DRAFT_291488 [Hypoxylon sp. FL0890]|nr:hypothetical protein F5Y06DRAFT_291488 [Hypoxylon sp. FL0890]
MATGKGKGDKLARESLFKGSFLSTGREQAGNEAEVREINMKLQQAEKSLHLSAQRVGSLEADVARRDEEIRVLRVEIEHREERIADLYKRNGELVDLLDKIPMKETNVPGNTGRFTWKQIERLAPDLERAYSLLWVVNPMMNKFFPSDFQQEFDFVVASVKGFVNDLMLPLMENDFRRKEVMSNAKRSGSAAGIIKWMVQYPEITRLARYDDDGVDMLTAIFMRWLDDHIFSTNLCGIAESVEDMLEELETSVRNAPGDRKNEPEMRRWRYNTYSGLLRHPDYRDQRKARENELTKLLDQLFGFLYPNPDYGNFEIREIIRVSIDLHERAMGSLEGVSCEFPSILAGVPGQDSSTIVSSLVDKADEITCHNILHGNQEFFLDKDNKDQALANLDPICSITPTVIFTVMDDWGRDSTELSLLSVRTRTKPTTGTWEDRD